MNRIETIYPQNVFHYFSEISAIPHGSGNMDAICNYCITFAKERNLEVIRDPHNNIIIKKPASKGYEDRPVTILQGHLDMVCVKRPDVEFDFEKDSIKFVRKGDYLYADGTTLGADDGIAVAMILAILDSKHIKHPALEAVFTSDEEVGLVGASAMDASVLTATRMINLDSEEEGVLTVSCAGGIRVKCNLPITREMKTGKFITLTVTGLVGGHSGMEINKGRGNSNCIMGRVLHTIHSATPIQIVTINGGKKENAIPSRTTAKIWVSNVAVAQKTVDNLNRMFKKEYASADPDLICLFEKNADEEMEVLDSRTTEQLVHFLTEVPNGVQSISEDMKGMVQTSLNFGILTDNGDSLDAYFSIRSSVGREKTVLYDQLCSMTHAMGGSVESWGEYPAWEYQKDSPLRDIMVKIFKEQYGHDPVVTAIHAGLECGIFAGKMPGLDCVSIGPDLSDVHSPNEHMSISSVARVFEYLLEVLKQ